MVRLLRELALPFTEISVFLSVLLLVGLIQLALLISTVFTQVALALGLLVALLAAFVLLPVCARYLMEILDARLADRELPPLSPALLGRQGLVWSIAPLLCLVGAGWAIFESSARFGYQAAVAVTGVFVTVLPASLGVLVVSGSVLASLDPRNSIQLIRLCRWRYLLVPAVIAGLVVSVEAVRALAVPQIVLLLAWAYAAVIAFSFTGAVIGDSGARELVGIPDPVEPDQATVTAGAERIRQQVLNHAYGLFSRGNGQGGQAYIEQYLVESVDMNTVDERDWFFWQMLRWESSGPALFFAREYLSVLLARDDHHKALKILSRCLHENPGFRPRPEDTDRLADIAGEAGRDELRRIFD